MTGTTRDDKSSERFTPARSIADDEFRVHDTAPSARRTDRRRQIIVIAFAFAAVALIGVGIAALSTSDDRSPYPVLGQAQLEELADSAGRALEDRAPGFRKNVPVTVEIQGATYGISHSGSSPLKWSRGKEFELAALCMGPGPGPGTVTVQWLAPGRVSGELPVSCSKSGKIARTRFTPLADGQLIQFMLMADDEAIGRAGMAVNIIEFH